MNISQAAKTSGLTPRMIRHYENIGLLPSAERSPAGYRRYDQRELHTLRFIHRARTLGFSIEQIGHLLALWQDRERSSAEVKALVKGHLLELEEKIAGLQAMHDSLAHLADCCRGDSRPDCPILDNLAERNIASVNAAG
ncbi:MAG TPA: Cu(I)-responsive transcriptional regulator [Pseudomonas xinjiangensis]|uniref:Cu(I)-responsive transcriptional regulator n=2 Tax=root TaxID=1 RepID=A0A7V1BR90_9GAMM|nr:Cu(I)-responsive transcriptional regulator [Halopseudomonas xinjiangensis]HEC46201.1 Cu(I)-responsive transcriptional regulator [Halopseudomonas xinjiangensis]